MKYFLLKNKNDIIALENFVKMKKLNWSPLYPISSIQIREESVGYIVGLSDSGVVSDYGNFSILPDVRLYKITYNVKLKI
jgi:hypothetical protein